MNTATLAFKNAVQWLAQTPNATSSFNRAGLFVESAVNLTSTAVSFAASALMGNPALAAGAEFSKAGSKLAAGAAHWSVDKLNTALHNEPKLAKPRLTFAPAYRPMVLA